MKTVFLRVLEAEDKEAALRKLVRDPWDEHRFEVDPASFSSVPNSSFAYWVSDRLRSLFKKFKPVESGHRAVKQGLVTSADFRFVRVWLELPAKSLGRCWHPFAKGGAFSPYYSDLELVVDWRHDGAQTWAIYEMRRAVVGGIIKNPGFYFRPGLTWPRRTNGLSIRVLPENSIFADKGPAIFVDSDDSTSLLALAAIANSLVFGALISIQLARTELAQSYEVGLIQRTPVPNLDDENTTRLAALARRASSLKRSLDTRTETSHAFVLPALLQVDATTLTERREAWAVKVRMAEEELAEIQAEIDKLCFDLYGIEDDDRRAIIEGFGQSTDDGEADEDEEIEVEVADEATLAAELVSWAVGVAFGRFDVRLATGDRQPPAEPEPFDPLPKCSPAMLQTPAGLPAEKAPEGYPLDLPEYAPLLDDPGHPRDLTTAVREVFQVVFGATADARLQEITALLDPKARDLRNWLAKGFFEHHLKRHSKSRRKAPILWQLATPTASYSAWLYIHRAGTDSLYRLLQDDLDPKLRHEELRLASLLQSHGQTPTASQRKEAAEQERFVDELRTLRDEIARVAPLFDPDLDDGVLINFAPLWRLTPQHRAWQKATKACFKKLAAGEYDWSRLAMRLWPERVVPKCAKDRSLAIAHDLEDTFWHEDDGGKWQPREVGEETVQELVEERSFPAVRAALDSLMETSGRPKG